MGIPTLNKISNAIWGTTTTTSPSSYTYSGVYPISVSGSAEIFTTPGSWGSGVYEPPAIPEAQQRIEITFKDGGTTILSLKDYIIFVALHGKSPSECTKQEYEELSFGERV